VYPALTVIKALLEGNLASATLPALAPADVLWIGSRSGLEEDLVKREGIEFAGLAAGGLRGVGLPGKIQNSIRIVGSMGRARDILRRFEPDVILSTGGYACVAVTLAGWIQNVPLAIYLPDIVPGLAIRLLGRLADKILVTSEESYHFFRREKVVVSGYPVRPDIYQQSRVEARRALGLHPEEKTLLVFGGSRGARSINRALVAGLADLLPRCQILHISGKLDTDWVAGVAKGLPDPLRARYHHYPYLHEMADVLVAADLVVARAGAATLGEFPAARLPAILVPYPHSGQHQMPNAEHLVRNGAAQLLDDADLEAKLVPTVLELLADEGALSAMRESTTAMARIDAAEIIAEQLWSLARQRAVLSSLPSGRGTEEGAAQP
jgi:UDP-N-acetylglucosamine--N-acetylmuramyl-(pentapeptide) pyrophosphoryl-undecaprenol N-acetylglucosamine transferase